MTLGGAGGKEATCQWRSKRYQLDSWVRKILWRWAWHPIPVFLPGEWGRKELVMTEGLSTSWHQPSWSLRFPRPVLSHCQELELAPEGKLLCHPWPEISLIFWIRKLRPREEVRADKSGTLRKGYFNTSFPILKKKIRLKIPRFSGYDFFSSS